MRCKLLAALCLFFVVNSSAQNLEVFNPPASGGTGYSDLFSGPNILGQAHVNGITVYLPWGKVDTGSSGPCVETQTSTTCDWSQIDPQLMSYINGPASNGLASHTGQKLNLIVEMIPETNAPGFNNNIPSYVFQTSTYGTWCSGCAAQDVVTCSDWPGDKSAPTCNPSLPNPTPSVCASPRTGVWNSIDCHITGGGSCITGPYPDFSGYPVLYEAPLMTAFQKFVDTVIRHYSSQGTTSTQGPNIGHYIGYIRPGLASGGENLPACTITNLGNPPAATGVWPSPQGLSYDLHHIPAIAPDWYATTQMCPGGTGDEAACRGKYAYIAGSPNSGSQTTDGPGYVKTMFAAFQASLTHWVSYYPHPVQIVGSAHSGPPLSGDYDYADREAPIYMGSAQPGGCGYCGTSGFGQESLSEYDVWDPVGGKCDDDWCQLFSTYHSFIDGGNFYLQTTIPNTQPTYTISQIVNSYQGQSYQFGLVICASTCTSYSPPTGSVAGIYPHEGFALLNSNGTKSSYKVAANAFDPITGAQIEGVLSPTMFTCDGIRPCPLTGTQQFLWSGDYIPDTIPFAKSKYASTLEIYFCDWEFAYNTSAVTGCATPVTPTSGYYKSVLDNP